MNTKKVFSHSSTALLWACVVVLVGILGYLIIQKRYGDAGALGAGLAGLCIPAILHRFTKIILPAWLQLILTVFVILSVLCGFVFNMYERWWPWDDVMHALSGVVVGIFGIVLITQVCKRWAPKLPTILRIATIGMMAAFVAVLWEIGEFSMDHLFGFFMQRNDLFDTMTDMIFGTGVAILTAVAYYSWKHLAARRPR